MLIRVKLVLLTALLQLGSLALLSGGMIVVFGRYGERQIASSEEFMRHAVARAAQDALIQKDQVQLLSYLNFLKGQYPALTYAKVSWRQGGKSSARALGVVSPRADVAERRVAVEDPSRPGSSVEVAFGVDREALEAPFVASRRRIYRMIFLVALGTGAAGLAVSFLLAHRLTRPLEELGRLASEIGRGRLGVRLDWESQDELGTLVRAFNMMSERLSELDMVKRNFVSSVTHELRSPLGAIESFLQLIREKTAAGGAEALLQSLSYLDRISTNVSRLSGFINDLLCVAAIERGKMECVLRPMQLAPVAEDVVQFFEAKAGRQGVVLENELKASPPVMGDADRVRQVLVNLVSNGLKFTPAGGKIRIFGEQYRADGQRWLEVTVADSGRGMDESDRLSLFQPFTQGKNVSEGVTGHKGTGLGLYIVKSIISQHGGKIEFKSAPGQGTQVSFSLRIAA